MIPEMAADVSTSVVALRVTEDEVLDTANADVEGLVPSVILVKAVSATIQDSEGSVFATLAVLDAEGDELLDSAGAVVLVGPLAGASTVDPHRNHGHDSTRVNKHPCPS